MIDNLALNTIHQGDCIAGLERLPVGCVDLAFADPPFNIGYEYDVYHDNRDYHEYLDWTQRWMSAVCRVLKPDGTFWIAIGDEFAAEIKLIAQRDLKLTCRSWVIWYYTFGVHCTRKFTRSHAHLFHFVKDAKRFTFNEDEISVQSARQLVYADGRANPAGRIPDDTWILRPQDVSGGFSPPEQTWYFPRVAGTFKERAGFHGCQMPEQLLGRIIRTSSNPGDLVLDPFSGSGTTLTVAKKLGRKWLGHELSPEYVQQAKKRIREAYEGQPLDGGPEPVLSAPRTPGNTSKVWLRSVVTRAIVEAFTHASDGWSTDRVIADPELNLRYCEECEELGLPGGPADWNRALMRLRKSGKLEFLPRARRTTFQDEEFDQYIFASEIAMRQITDEIGTSLDDVLCDPQLAAKFDSIARTVAPGPFSSLQYRWAALTLRKRAHECRTWSDQVPPDLERRRFLEFKPLREIVTLRFASVPGLYLARKDADQSLYLGESLDLGKRLQCHQESQGWNSRARGTEVGVLPLEGVQCKERLGLQSRRITRLKPAFNYLPPESDEVDTARSVSRSS